MLKPTEYEFTRRNGSKAYEIVDPECGYTTMQQIRMFMSMHNAISAKPIRQGTERDRRVVV